jgi:hypothetical protein
MYTFSHKKGFNTSSKVKKHSGHLALVLIVISAIFIARLASIIIADINQSKTPAVASQTTVQEYFNPLVKTFSNEYFEFDSTREWSLSPRATAKGRTYEYVARSGGLVDYVMNITLDNVSVERAVSFVLPVEVRDNKLTLGALSERCKTDEEGAGLLNDVVREHEGIAFLCYRQANARSTLLVGQREVGPYFELKTPSGQSRNVSIIFEDLRGELRLDALREVLESIRVNDV